MASGQSIVKSAFTAALACVCCLLLSRGLLFGQPSAASTTFLFQPLLPARTTAPAARGVSTSPGRRADATAHPSSAVSLQLQVALVAFAAAGAAGLRVSRKRPRTDRRLLSSRVRVQAQSGFAELPPPDAEELAKHPVQTEPAPADLREQRQRAAEQVRALGETTWPAPENDRLLRAARGEPVDRPPKWLMRQAGRYLPEYRAVLAENDFFSVCQSPALAAEVTLQPYRRYPTLDSLIIFSDILVIPVAMGMKCRMVPSSGPQFDFGLNSPADFSRLNFKPDIEKSLGYVFDAIHFTRLRVENKVPVIGFSGAPWTLMGYMVEGGATRSFEHAKKWLYLYPDESRELLKALRDVVVDYLVGQYDSGAPLLTIFDTNCGELPPAVYEEFCVPDLKYIAEEVKRRRPGALLTVFPKDGELQAFEDSAYNVVGVSWTTSPAEARRMCPTKTLQGNLDPYLLYADEELIGAKTREMVAGFGVDRYIANLGHGMMPSHPVGGPKAFIEAIDACTHESMASDATA
eukprot:TRINITY_DN29172_c0_g1_i1.p1 TRINITY_DN29172_c0_g1~~TRINITY_DN29172_c0_g1_i1.p1  ORF type:complete len:526 (+),score=87.27 TRINITY_DN29172_c0_g1_i1:24-1580(+)